MSAHLYAPVSRRIPLLSIDFCGSMGFVQGQEGFAWEKCMAESRFAHCAAYASHIKQIGVDLQGPFSRNRTLCNTAQRSRRPRNIFIIDINRNRKQRKIDQGILNVNNSGRSAVYHLCRHVGPCNHYEISHSHQGIDTSSCIIHRTLHELEVAASKHASTAFSVSSNG